MCFVISERRKPLKQTRVWKVLCKPENKTYYSPYQGSPYHLNKVKELKSVKKEDDSGFIDSGYLKNAHKGLYVYTKLKQAIAHCTSVCVVVECAVNPRDLLYMSCRDDHIATYRKLKPLKVVHSG